MYHQQFDVQWAYELLRSFWTVKEHHAWPGNYSSLLVAQPQRRLPFHVRKDVEKNLKDKVLLKQARQKEITRLYDLHPFRVLERSNQALFCSEVMRNVLHAHKLHKNTRIRQEDDYVENVDLQLTLDGQRNEMREDLFVSDVHQHIWRTISFEQLLAELMSNISTSF